jgi:hypothetical protein
MHLEESLDIEVSPLFAAVPVTVHLDGRLQAEGQVSVIDQSPG